MTSPRAMTGTHAKRSRFTCLIALLVAANALLIPGASASTTASAPVSVEVVDVGSFSIEMANGGITFTGEDGGVPGVTAFSGATAHATLPILISDTRADQSRDGYEVTLVMGGLSIDGASDDAGGIEASNITVTAISGLPEGIEAGFQGPASLASPVSLFRTEGTVPALETTIYVSIDMHIPAGTMPGSFSGSISIEVIPVV